MSTGWQPPAARTSRVAKARSIVGSALMPALVKLRERSDTFVLWTPESLGGGNHLYMWMYAWEICRTGRHGSILMRPGMDAWIEEFPALAALTTKVGDVPFTADRRLEWGQRYPGADVMGHFLDETLLRSDRFRARVEAARASLAPTDVVVNVRRGDYYTNPEFAKNYAMDQAYLMRLVIDEVLSPRDVGRVVVVSDDPGWCRAQMPGLLPGYDVEVRDLTPFDTLALLAAAPELVLSNSTFSYWGGYLNERLRGDGSHVHAPRFHSRHSVGGTIWQQSPEWHLLDNLEHEMTRLGDAKADAAPAGADVAVEVPPQVVFLANSMCPPNGVVSAVAALAREFVRRGVDVRILAMGEVVPHFAEEFGAVCLRPHQRFTTGVKNFETSRGVLKPVRRALTPYVTAWERRRLREQVAQIAPDALVIAAGMECLEYVTSTQMLPAPVFVQVHTSFAGLQPDQLARLERCAKVAEHITTLTPEDADAVRARGHDSVITLANPCPVGPLAELPDKRREVVFAGRLAPEKQVDHLVRAFAAAAVDGWSLQIYGNGPERADLEALAARQDARIEFHGPVPDVTDALSGASLHAMSSRFEGLPMVALEASAVGTPTVGYACSPGMIRAVDGSGVLVPPGDEASLADALRDLMTDPDEIARLAHAALTDRRYDPETIGAEWIDTWARLVRDREASGTGGRAAAVEAGQDRAGR